MTGLVGECDNVGEKKVTAVKMMGAVSPATRPIPRIVPVIMPGRAAGSTILYVVCHLVAPRASEASRNVNGTFRNASSAAEMIVGKTSSARVSHPANRLTPKWRDRKSVV